jgi:hypothetical protein
VSLVNSERSQYGLPSIGFLNPALYSPNYTNYFNDVTSGNNNCCAYPDEKVCCDAGFTATEGWDPVTGWGSISFVNFALLFNASVPYVVTPNEVTVVPRGIVGIVITVSVLTFIFSSVVWFVWCSFCKPRPREVTTALPRTNVVPQTQSVNPQGWPCPTCTYINSSTERRCRLCGTVSNQQ